MFPLSLDLSTLNLEEKFLCLDFSNTLDWRNGRQPVEGFQTYQDLISWAQTVRLVDPTEAATLLEQAQQRPDEAAQVRLQAVDLRETIYRIFSAIAHHRPVEPSDLETLNDWVSRAMASARLSQPGQSFTWQWQDNHAALDWILLPIARSAADLLTSGKMDRVGECASEEGCGWLFYDTSKNHSRRWCSMESCGNRSKVSRHYYRKTGHAT